MVGRLAWLKNVPDYIIILLVLAAIALSLFAINQYSTYKKGRKKSISKLSDNKIEKTIREWIDIPSFSIERKELEPNVKFNFLVKDNQERKINVVRDNQIPEIIQLLARLKISTRTRPFNASELKKVTGKITIEMARLGIEYKFDGSPNPLEFIRLIYPVILEDSLTEFYFRRRILFVLSAMVLVIEITKQAAEELGL